MFHLRRSIRSIQQAYSHLNRAQNVTTWSPLANHFNAKPEDDRWSFLKCERTVSYPMHQDSIIYFGESQRFHFQEHGRNRMKMSSENFLYQVHISTILLVIKILSAISYHFCLATPPTFRLTLLLLLF